MIFIYGVFPIITTIKHNDAYSGGHGNPPLQPVSQRATLNLESRISYLASRIYFI